MFLKSNKIFFKSLSFRLTFGYAILFVFSSILILFLNYYLFNQSIKERDHVILYSKAKEYSSIYSKGGIQELKSYLAEQKQSDSDSQFLIRIESANAETLFLHIPEKMQKLSANEVDKKISTLVFPKKNISKFYMKENSIDDPDEENEYEVASQTNFDGQRIQVARNTDERDDLLERYLQAILGVSFAVLLIGSSGGFIFSKQALAPLRNLIKAIRLVRSGELSARVPVRNSNDEVDEISILFNEMTEKIEKLISNMHETLDNVAHDLKTPLTRLKTKAELTLLAQSSKEDYKEALESAIDNTTEIVSLVNTIMDISEAEAGVLKLDLVEINSKNIILEIIDLYSMIAEEKNISIQLIQTADFNFYADKNRCKQVLSNLIDNAIKYSPKHSLIQIISRCVDGKNEICILDSGIGISEQDIPKIWNRLYRVHHNQSNKGLGLGLSLVRSICKAHGWVIQVQSQLGVGSEFKLSFRSRS